MKKIEMVDLVTQYHKIEHEINASINEVLRSGAYIQGKSVREFEEHLRIYTGATHCITCANGTDALQIAMMALGLNPGDEIIVPSFTYIATAEAAAVLGIKPVFAEVSPATFNIDTHGISSLITEKTKAIIPVHLYGQCADMEPLLNIAKQHGLYVIEDAAQAIGASYIFSNGTVAKAGSMGDIGITSFFPSKNLGCYGDGGALFTNNDDLAKKIKMIANHGQERKYYHDMIGINSRLDTLQAAILKVKLTYLDSYINARKNVAQYYDKAFVEIAENVKTPVRAENSTHVFHQYTIRLNGMERDNLKIFLEKNNIPTMVYYPLPIHLQKAYTYLGYKEGDLPVSEQLCKTVLSLPIHSEMNDEQLSYIAEKIIEYYTLEYER
ncbi:MAG: DegT/DnrJ/EryC1/StrS family aminotransferase [Cytophagaceae bacterium]|nr:DegT/DnrJ/EryC1/StrS family aminotransferase [Cytophagaceae bacterium]MDW8456294.1 DegT/DnrJ/EryC1/StrS family aminotransferase [Cytophagaceae bacterium]